MWIAPLWTVANAGLLPEPPHSVGPPSPPVAAINSNDPHSTRGGDFTNLAPASERTAGNPADAPGALICALVTFLIAVGMKPAVRRKFHSALGSLIAKGEAKAAATVAGLVGGRSPSEALKHGTATFRGLPLQSLALSDLTTNDDTGLHAKTVKASLGEVHAFLSHSWHDEADAKCGMAFNPDANGEIWVTVVATGLGNPRQAEAPAAHQAPPAMHNPRVAAFLRPAAEPMAIEAEPRHAYPQKQALRAAGGGGSSPCPLFDVVFMRNLHILTDRK